MPGKAASAQSPGGATLQIGHARARVPQGALCDKAASAGHTARRECFVKGFAMGMKDFLEEAAGAFAADKALEAADPEAGFLAKAAAAVAGYEGVAKLKEHFAEGDQPAEGETASDNEEAQDQQPEDGSN
ncbi:MAG: hypothetical protein KGM49_11755 [Sphingomonadales bacterium]|nr:hypothetical protein [Sphingomonadales bacterium]